MAKKRIANYVFSPGVSSNSNAYPNAYSLLQANTTFIKKEAVAYIAAQIIADTANNIYPNAVALVTNNRAFILDEVSAWTTAQVAGASIGSTFYGYTYTAVEIAKCRRDMGYLIDALLYDLRYGGNERVSFVASQYYLSGVVQVINLPVETAIQAKLWNLTVGFVMQKILYSPSLQVTSTQNTSGTVAEGAATTQAMALSVIVSNVINGGLSTIPTTIYSVYNFPGYVYDTSKCERDIGYVLTAYLNDLRYGGNVQTRLISSRYWDGQVAQVDGDRKPEIATHTFIRGLINNTVLPEATYTPLQGSYPQIKNAGIAYEAASTTRITALAGVVLSVIQNGLSSLPVASGGVSTIKIQGQYALDKLLLITNATDNAIIYNFSDPTLGAVASFDAPYNSNGNYTDVDYPKFLQTTDAITTLILKADTSTASSTDDIQIFVEAEEQKTRPYDFGTDAIERMRVAQPQSMLDADFEYGLQPTKWQAIGVARGYPSVYEIPGTDTPVISVTTDASNGAGGIGESLITVTTQGAHGLTAGTPITIRSLANTISGFSRAEGTFIIISVPSSTTFTYYATAKVGTSNGQVLATTYTQLRKGAFYTGASIGQPTISVYSNGLISTFTTKFITASNTDQMAVNGVLPGLGAPISGTGITPGTQVSGTVGPGGLAVTSAIVGAVEIGATTVTLADPTGVLEGMAIDNGSGTAIFVSGIAGPIITLTQPNTIYRPGSFQTYLNVTGTNVTPTGTGAQFSVTRTSGVYGIITVTTPGTNYVSGTRIKILGTSLGGTTPANDLLLKVAGVTAGAIDTVTKISGYSVLGERSYSALPQSSTTASGIGATFNVVTSGGVYDVTLAAGGSTYSFGEVITILGSALGGVNVTNDLTLTVTGANSFGGGVLTFNTAGRPASTDTTFTALSGTKVTPGTGASFDVTRGAGTYTTVVVNLPGAGYGINDVILISGSTFNGVTGVNDITITITDTSIGAGAINSVSGVGTAVGGTSIDFYSAVALSDVTTLAIADGTSISTAAIATLQITFASNHGLVPGASMLIDVTSTGTNHEYAKGPFYVESVPTPTTVQYTARTSGAISTSAPLVGTVYSRPDSYFIHRPYDGGVQLGTGGPQHGAQAIRMSKKYIRYQSGKGVMYTTGALFAPSYNLQAISADGVAIGSYITVTTDDVDHGCQVGGKIKIIGVDTAGYNGVYSITDVINERMFKVQAQTTLSNVYGTITTQAQMSVLNWHGASVRAGTYDDQNGMFWQYDGQTLSVVRRSSTLQMSGVASIAKDANVVTGTNTRFRDQVKAGDRIVIKGMTHVVSNVQSQTQMTVTPDYRGASNAVQAKVCLVQDLVVKQSEFNLDRLDGTGPSGYNLDITKMQMIGMQWSWYGAGFIDFMLRGSDGNYVFAHRMRNSNVNTEAYMRTGNMPVRYEVINESASSKLISSITASQTTIPLVDAVAFPNEAGTVYIDNELISFSGKSGNVLTGCTRSSPLINFVGGAQRSFRASSATTHEVNTGVILISNTISPIISHWGSAMLTDGRFDDDRGYLFNYASTGIQASTTKQTAFLIRLAPSVSNAIIGDLGDRELINRAQLLLKTISVTSDTGTGGLVIEGVLNPQNYPIDPSAISWSGLAGSSAGGQPSFAQVAPGGSVSWSGGASVTTATASTTAALTGTATVPNNALFQSAVGSNVLYVTKASWDSLGAATGFSVAASETKYPSGTTVSTITANPAPTATTLGLITGTATVPNNVGFNQAAGSNLVNFTQASWQALGAVIGSTVYSADFPVGTTVTNIAGPGVLNGLAYYQVTFSQNSLSAHNASNTVTFYVTGQAAIGATTLNFTQASWGALPIGSAVVTNTTNDVGKFANGTQISAISALKTFAGVNYYTVTFNTTLLAAQAASVAVTFTFIPYYIILLSKNASSTVAANATVAFTPAVISTNTSFLYFTQVSWETLVTTNGVTTGTEIVDVLKFPSGTKVASIASLATFAGTAYYRVNFTQSSIAAVAPAATITFQFGLPPYAQPGETVFSFISAPGGTSVLDLNELKELTNTTLGGRGTYPNGPDVLAINVYRASGTGSLGTNIVVRWGEAQA